MAHVEPSVRPYGWPRRNNFLQPLFEAALREKLADSDSVELWLGARLAGYEQDADGVTADIEDSDGEPSDCARSTSSGPTAAAAPSGRSRASR